MVKKTGKRDAKLRLVAGATKRSLDDEVDDLFKLPLAEFTGARNALAAQLKKDGRQDDATLVKALTKPSITAWAVNQLYWKHRRVFDRLIASGQRFHQSQKSGAGKIAEMRGSLEARRESLAELGKLAENLLQEAGHNPSGDAIRRINTNLEAISAYASLAELSHDFGECSVGLLYRHAENEGRLGLDAPRPAVATLVLGHKGQARAHLRNPADRARRTHPNPRRCLAASVRRKSVGFWL